MVSGPEQLVAWEMAVESAAEVGSSALAAIDCEWATAHPLALVQVCLISSTQRHVWLLDMLVDESILARVRVAMSRLMQAPNVLILGFSFKADLSRLISTRMCREEEVSLLVDLQVVIAKAGKSKGGVPVIPMSESLSMAWWTERGLGSDLEVALGPDTVAWLGMHSLQETTQVASDGVKQLIASAGEQPPSLKKLCEVSTGCTMDKRKQRSDWARRPLEESQEKYAALDALVLARIYCVLARGVLSGCF